MSLRPRYSRSAVAVPRWSGEDADGSWCNRTAGLRIRSGSAQTPRRLRPRGSCGGSSSFEIGDQAVHEHGRLREFGLFGGELLKCLVYLAELEIEIAQMGVKSGVHPFVLRPGFLVVLLEFLDLHFGRDLARRSVRGVHQLFVMPPRIERRRGASRKKSDQRQQPEQPIHRVSL